MLLEVSLLGLESRDLSLHLGILTLLVEVVLLHFFLGLEHICRQTFPDVLSLASQGVIERLLLGAEVLDLLLVEVELFGQRSNRFLEAVDFALQSGRERALVERSVGATDRVHYFIY